ncbi:ornithine cyclodeaminase family protein [Leucobacter insecticola]|uniref:Ornithine cyclodeaminase family protein n=1 Tax=Leucobacter insecticola TaxID=2714934 RepID=A0A6G8FI29_9MICO|nr:ornithine cyclodeaminase family protein [Leucobacter insecticola]QIM16146.1 ornithine cyclodeaminase family protein [Leucobacter insecticola]
MSSIPYFDAAAVRSALPFGQAIHAIEESLRAGLDPEIDAPRIFSPAPDGEFLLMPAQGEQFSGLKALTVAPENPARGLPKIQGLYILIDSDTLSPVAIFEGASLTAIRTPAVTITAVKQLAAAASPANRLPDEPRVLVFGAGVQAEGHVLAMQSAFPGAQFQLSGRSPERVSALVNSLTESTRGLSIRAVSGPVNEALNDANVILCTTSSDTPIFHGSSVASNAIVAAVGTHGRNRREVDDALVRRADVLVEGRRSAARENGNLSTALSPADWEGRNAPKNLREAVLGGFRRRDGHPAFYSGVGMSWQDLVCATEIWRLTAVR